MATLNQENLAIHCGKTTDSYKKLESICEAKANEIKGKLDFSTQSEIEISFWTENFPELICVGTFSKNNLGEVVFELDYSQTTL